MLSSSATQKILNIVQIATPIGTMVAVADDDNLYLLEFVECNNLNYKLNYLQHKTFLKIVDGVNKTLESIQEELSLYFSRKLIEFKTSILLLGTPFQQNVWKQLQHIPYGHTWSYSDLAKAVDNPQACRAVASANRANRFAIVIPCHRVINTGGKVGGYAGGISKKERLLAFEKLGFEKNELV